jgi:hypothetical protein
LKFRWCVLCKMQRRSTLSGMGSNKWMTLSNLSAPSDCGDVWRSVCACHMFILRLVHASGSRPRHNTRWEHRDFLISANLNQHKELFALHKRWHGITWYDGMWCDEIWCGMM